MSQNDRDDQAAAPPPPDDLHDVLQDRSRAKRSPLTMVLAAVVLVTLGALGGVLIGRSMNDSTPQVATPPFGNGAGGFPSPGSGNGVPGGFPNGNGNVTVGTIESVDGNAVTVRTPNGDTVTVKIGDSTRIQVTKDGSVSDLASGDSVVVAGSRNGRTVTATSITEGGFGGGFPGAAG